MLDSIRRIRSNNEEIEFLERHFPSTLAMAKELELFEAKLASIPTYLNWLCAPQDFALHGPKFLKASAKLKTIYAIIDAVSKV